VKAALAIALLGATFLPIWRKPTPSGFQAANTWEVVAGWLAGDTKHQTAEEAVKRVESRGYRVDRSELPASLAQRTT